MFIATTIPLAALALAVGSATVSADPLFAAPFLSFDAGKTPWSLAIADFDRDAKADVVVANGSFGTLSVLLGNGDGTMNARTEVGTGSEVFSVAAGDLNGDAHPDLVSANSGTYPSRLGSVSVRLGNGDGTFGAGMDYGTGRGSRSVVIADLNGDGKPDLAVANGDSTTVSVLLGNGDGMFGANREFETGPSPSALAIADLNGDGKPDAATTHMNTNTVSVLLGGGDGTFAAAMDFETGNLPSSVAIGDLNGDGKPDLAVTNLVGGSVSVLPGIGDGTFESRTDLAAGIWPNAVAIGDLNGDGHPDLTIADYGYNNVSVLLGNGDGTFGAAVEHATGIYPADVTLGDLNADGRKDVVTSDYASNTVSVLLGNGDGTFGARAEYATGNHPQCVALGDLNADGKLDLTVANTYGSTVSVWLGSGTGTLGPRTDIETGAYPISTALGDLNADGRLDLVVTIGTATNEAGTVSVLLGNGDGTFGAKSEFGAGDGPTSVAIGELNGDGIPDLVVSNWNSSTVSVLLGNGNGTFGANSEFGVGDTPSSVAIGDLNGDGIPDLVVTNWLSNTASSLLGHGDGTFGAKSDVATGYRPYSSAIGDLNRDGKLDLVVANSGDTSTRGKTVSVMLGNGDGTFGSSTDYGTGLVPWSVVVADLNGDGDADLAVTNLGDFSQASGNTVTVLLGNGNGTFGPRMDFGTGLEPSSVAFGDLNGDGKPDLAVANQYDNTVSFLLSADHLVPTQVSLVVASAEPGCVHLEWYAATPGFAATVYRRAGVEPWIALGQIATDGTGFARFDDRGVEDGRGYGYRLGIRQGADVYYTAETWVEVPPVEGFALEGLRPNPVTGPFVVALRLSSAAPVRLELLDVCGRRALQRDLRDLGPGRAQVRLDPAGLPAGLYFLRASQERRVLVSRTCVVR